MSKKTKKAKKEVMVEIACSFSLKTSPQNHLSFEEQSELNRKLLGSAYESFDVFQSAKTTVKRTDMQHAVEKMQEWCKQVCVVASNKRMAEIRQMAQKTAMPEIQGKSAAEKKDISTDEGQNDFGQN